MCGNDISKKYALEMKEEGNFICLVMYKECIEETIYYVPYLIS